MPHLDGPGTGVLGFARPGPGDDQRADQVRVLRRGHVLRRMLDFLSDVDLG